jgi:hypothetical protein
MKKYLIAILLFSFGLGSCKKYLDKKPDEKLVIPSVIQDLQGLLDQYSRVNQFNPSAMERSADDYYITSADWTALTNQAEKRIYLWEKDYVIGSVAGSDWSNAYDNVYKANVVLDEMPKIKRVPNDDRDRNACIGHAYFIRGSTFLKIAIAWSLAYDKATSSTDLGIPLRLSSDFNIPSTRSSLGETYAQIINDARDALLYLPNTPLHVLRPSKPAALALLARSFLAMREYDSCFKYANEFLLLRNELKDYNQLSASATYPFAPEFSNPEIVFNSNMITGSLLTASRAKIDSNLYQSFSINDLRKTIFFRNNNNGTFGFKGSYNGSAAGFDGVATDEVYLMRAECYARKGNVPEAMNDLNTLLLKRWKTNTFIPYTATNPTNALQLILTERRKELIFRGLRWMDIKRLNKEGGNIILQRIINGVVYTLPPNDLRYAIAIPESVIELTGMPQNPR